MHDFSPGRLTRMAVCSASTFGGIAWTVVYVHTESTQFAELFFAAFLLRTIHAFLTGTFASATILYRFLLNDTGVKMIHERRPVVYWFVIFACVHMILPLLRTPSLLLTAGTAFFLISTFVTLVLVGGWDAAINIAPKSRDAT